MSEKKNENDEITMNEYDESDAESESDEQLLRRICKEEIAEVDYRSIWEAIKDNEQAAEYAQEMASEAYMLAETAEGHAFNTVSELEDRLIALERAIEGILTKAKMVRRDADSGGDTEWY